MVPELAACLNCEFHFGCQPNRALSLVLAADGGPVNETIFLFCLSDVTFVVGSTQPTKFSYSLVVNKNFSCYLFQSSEFQLVQICCMWVWLHLQYKGLPCVRHIPRGCPGKRIDKQSVVGCGCRKPQECETRETGEISNVIGRLQLARTAINAEQTIPSQLLRNAKETQGRKPLKS